MSDRIIKEYTKFGDGEHRTRLYRPIRFQEDCAVYSKEMDVINKLEKKLNEARVSAFSLFFPEDNEKKPK